MVKIRLKKFFCFALVCVFSVSIGAFFVSCNSNELDKISKNLTTYTIAATLNDDMTVSCEQKVKYYNSTDSDLTSVCFHLYPRAFRKDATFKPYTSLTFDACFPNGLNYGNIEILDAKVVSRDDNKGDYLIVGSDDDILQVNLVKPLEKFNFVEIEIVYKLTLPNCTHRFGYYDKNINLANWYPIACTITNGEFDLTPYYSTGDPFCSDISNYEVSINYPKKYLLSSTGDAVTKEININESENNLKVTDDENAENEKTNEAKTENWLKSTIKAKAVRDFALCLSEDTAKISKVVGKTNISYVGYKSDEEFQKYLDVSVKAVEYFNKIFGEYPYSTLTVVKMPFIYGGMEYPNVVFISDSIQDEDEFMRVVVHEIAHQWWYAVVGNNEIYEAWLDESLTEYSTALFFKNNPNFGIDYNDLIKDAISSYSLYVDVIKTIRGEVNTKMNLAVNEYQNDYEYSYMIYIKGIIMFDELKNVVGETKLVSGLKKYYKNNKYKIATKKDFYDAFRQACHKDLENFFEGYLQGTTIISNIS